MCGNYIGMANVVESDDPETFLLTDCFEAFGKGVGVGECSIGFCDEMSFFVGPKLTNCETFFRLIESPFFENFDCSRVDRNGSATLF